MLNYKKYKRVPVLHYPEREWSDKEIEHAPMWCSVDLRDGNQALIDPMNVEEKMEMFRLLLKLGFKQIEIGFPAASQIEYDFLRKLVAENMIPDDVQVQVLTQCREHLIDRTFEAIQGIKNVIVHIYNSTSVLQRDVVFHKDKEAIKQIAIEGTRMVKERAKNFDGNIQLEYSPESFTGTEVEFALDICTAVQDIWEPTPENKIIFNLPATVEMNTPNVYADQIEWMHKHFKNRESIILSVHPHNDRGTGIAATELSLLAGADRVEGTLFGNGERTGNIDILNIAYNMFSQGIDPELNIENIKEIIEVYERCCKMDIDMRHPYAGKLVFTAFSGSHQDAINKGVHALNERNTGIWEVPYLPINPADLSREYEPVIRINSQSGKGGAAFVLQHAVGYRLPKEMHPEFGNIVKAASDAFGDELKEEQIVDLFNREYVEFDGKYKLASHSFLEQRELDGTTHTRFEGKIDVCGDMKEVAGVGNGPIDSFFQALAGIGVEGYEFVNYHEHAISRGSDAKGICYIELKIPGNGHIFGVGIDSNINVAALLGILCAINRAEK